VADRIIDYSGSPFRGWWFLCWSSIPLLWWGPQPDTGDRHCGASVQELIVRPHKNTGASAHGASRLVPVFTTALCKPSALVGQNDLIA